MYHNFKALSLKLLFETTPEETGDTPENRQIIEVVAVIEIAGKALVITSYRHLCQRSKGKQTHKDIFLVPQTTIL